MINKSMDVVTVKAVTSMSNQVLRYCMVGLLVFVCAKGQASLLGDTISGEITFIDYTFLGNCFGPDPVNPGCNSNFMNTSGVQPNAIVSESDDSYPNFLNNGYPEFLYSDTGSSGDFLDVAVDVDASSVRVDIVDRSSIAPEVALTPLAWRIDLTGLNDSAGSIIGANIISQSSSSPFTLGFTADSLEINFLGRRAGDQVTDLDQDMLTQWRTSGMFFANISLQTTPVPVPSALWLFGSGLIGLIGFAKRKACA